MKKPLEKLSEKELSNLLSEENIDFIIQQAEYLAATKTKDELLEMLGMSVSFKDQFKPGDMICSDEFHNGKVMIVEEFTEGIGEQGYTCQDLMIENQKWRAYELDAYRFRQPNNWRLATDKDIVNYILRFFTPAKETIAYDTSVTVDEDGIVIGDSKDFSLYLDKKEARKLKAFLNKWIVE